MSNVALYSIRQMAQELDLPESTVRYYRDTYSRYLSAIGSGRRRLYPDETLNRLRWIRDSYASGMSRATIETHLCDSPTSDASTPEPPGTNGTTSLVQYEDVLATILDGERERREAMWQVAREVVRLGEAIERQHAILSHLAEKIGNGDGHMSTNANRGSVETVELVPVAEAAPLDDTVETELTNLRLQLDRERELVERLRRSKVEVERRAADAEAQLEERGGSERRRSALRRLLLRDTDTR